MKQRIKNVLITRQPNQSVEFINELSKSGFHPFLLPMIKTIPLDYSVSSNNYDFIVFTSTNAVTYFANNLKKIKFKNIIAVGEKTASLLKQFDIIPNIIPDEFSAEGLIKVLDNMDIKNNFFLIPTTPARSDLLENYLKQRKALVEICYIYKTVEENYPEGYIDNFVINNNIDTVTFASPSAARSFLKQAKNINLNLLTIISIGKTTAKFLEKEGIKSYYPEKYTVKEMVKLISSLSKNN
ncbi:uroporphyrinogen-III synthase [Deferribacter autotrophicus]|uniref:Uroporphyrinogen-III synthase n=1 Tax=Deferribacter autotrophicus TaxID=500465 RepID=A0A5A8F6P1_9BACT|nr:uroporphyrinogen-III synthase [Deferribacter autotrophicus]KAA0259500.1 uroporphyrinogen-III synthase [Deferribacter autotrophicus]